MNRQITLLLLALAGAVQFAHAHSAICDCYDNGDNTITCEGGFSDGRSAAGVPMRVIDDSGKLLIESGMSEQSDFTFNRPAGNFHVEFEGGTGHVIQIDGRDIEE